MLNDLKFMTSIVNELCDTSSRISAYLWRWAKIHAHNLLHNQTGFDTQCLNDGIFLPDMPVDMALVKWWTMLSDNYGHGIFHQAQWNPVALKYVMVSLDISTIAIIPNVLRIPSILPSRTSPLQTLST